MRARNCDRLPVVRTAVAPGFPELARVVRIQGDITVETTISESGVVNSAMVLSSTRPAMGFEGAALAAAKRWTFDAKDQCAARRVELLFRFRKPVAKGDPFGVEFRPPFQIDVVVEGPDVIGCDLFQAGS